MLLQNVQMTIQIRITSISKYVLIKKQKKFIEINKKMNLVCDIFTFAFSF